MHRVYTYQNKIKNKLKPSSAMKNIGKLKFCKEISLLDLFNLTNTSYQLHVLPYSEEQKKISSIIPKKTELKLASKIMTKYWTPVPKPFILLVLYYYSN